MAALTSNGVGTCGADDNQAQAGHLIAQPLALRGREHGIGGPGGPYHALRSGDGSSSRNQLIAVSAVHENQRGEVTQSDTMGALKVGGGKPGQGYPAISLAVAGDFSSGEDVAQTIRATNGQPGGVLTETVVRRLTELECERLQGFPDGWTAGQSGSARYRQLGNTVAVPVVEWIAHRLIKIDDSLKRIVA